jgi:hypothetical protein
LGKSNDILITTPSHNRFHSERNVSYYDRLGIRKNTNTQDYSVRRNHNFHVVQELNEPNQLKKINSRSLEKNLPTKNEEDDGDLNYSFLNSQEFTKPCMDKFHGIHNFQNLQNFHGYTPINNYLINLHPTTDMIEIKLQHNFQDFISPSLDMELRELGIINAKKNYLFDNFNSTNFEPYETRYETLEDPTDSILFSDGEEEGLMSCECAEEILEISDDSQNFFLMEDDKKEEHREEDVVKNIFTSLKTLKMSLGSMSRMNINIINLYKCVNKN